MPGILSDNSCPQGCSIGILLLFRPYNLDVTQREMVPCNPRGRRLIVLYGHSSLEVFALDRAFGGDQDRAKVTISELGGIIQELLGWPRCEKKKWSVLNGFRTGCECLCHGADGRNEIHFHYSLVISICSDERHPYSAQTFSRPEPGPVMKDDMKENSSNEMEVESTILEPSTYNNPKMLDLSTESSLIGTGNLAISLKELCLHQHAVDGVVTLYAVFRNLGTDPHTWKRVGKEAIFSFNKSWVCNPH